MQSDALQCPICIEDYNLEDKLPRMLPKCGHTICTECLGTLLKSLEPNCPLDKQLLTDGEPEAKAFPINYSLKHLVQENSQWEVCKTHNSRMEIACMADRCKLCLHCAFFGGHKCHELKPMTEIKVEIDNKKKDLENVLVNLDNYKEGVEGTLEKRKTWLLNFIEAKFEEIMFILQVKKLELSVDVERFFEEEKKCLNATLGKESELRTRLERKIESFKNYTSQQDPFVFLEDDISDYKLKLESNSLKDIIKELEEKLKEMSDSFEKPLLEQVKLFSGLQIPVKELRDKLDKVYIGVKKDEKLIKDLPSLEKKTIIDVDIEKKRLDITVGKKSLEKVDINIDDLGKMKVARVLITDTALDYKDLKPLIYIWSKMSNLESISVIVHNQSDVCEEILNNILSLIFWKPQNLLEIEVNIVCSKVKDSSVILLANKVFAKALKLRGVKMILYDTQVTDNALQTFTKSMLPLLPHLESFEIDLGETKVKEDSIIELFVAMPDLKKFELGLSHAYLTDHGLGLFIANTLTSTRKLESLKLSLSHTQITDDTVADLFFKLRDLRKLHLDLTNTSITDKSIIGFLKEKLPNLKLLKDFTFDLLNTQVSDAQITQIERIKKNL